MIMTWLTKEMSSQTNKKGYAVGHNYFGQFYFSRVLSSITIAKIAQLCNIPFAPFYIFSVQYLIFFTHSSSGPFQVETSDENDQASTCNQTTSICGSFNEIQLWEFQKHG